jgi:dTDP-4-dehydrorhamnose reductase
MSTDKSLLSAKPELWGGMECTINRVGDSYRDQLLEIGHYSRPNAIELLKSLNLRALRYPILWERYQSQVDDPIDWKPAEQELNALAKLNIRPIVGLLHHGSGPSHTNLLDDEFPEKFSAYALKVATRFPDIEWYCPINEPLTTARFSGLYGFWYPHHDNPLSFARMMINQLKGVILAMKNIRRVAPHAKLIQTEDLCKVHATEVLHYQRDFENERRWLSYDLLCGKVTPTTAMWNYFISTGIDPQELEFFTNNVCAPDLLGLNYYVTSERYLDHEWHRYPHLPSAGNGIHQYIDAEAYRFGKAEGLDTLLKEVWARYQLPLAITESHLACTREEQMRWLKETWSICCDAKSNGIPIEAFTVWALFGAYDWNTLLRQANGHYETGVFKVHGHVTPTALAKMITTIGSSGDFNHPLLKDKGWWHGENRMDINVVDKDKTPLLIVGRNGVLAKAFATACVRRNIYQVSLGRYEIDITSMEDVIRVIDLHKPWGVINAAGFVQIDEAETQPSVCYSVNAIGPEILAKACNQKGIPFMTFSSDQVFNGDKIIPYEETDEVAPLNYYGMTKAKSEEMVAAAYSSAMIIRSSAFFGPSDRSNFAYRVLNALEQGIEFCAVNDVVISPTYIPHLVETSLDLFIDENKGIWHLSNEDGSLTWLDFARELAARGGYKYNCLKGRALDEMKLKAKRPQYSVLRSNKGGRLPSLTSAMEEFFSQRKY